MGKIKCLKCNHIIESRYRHDFVQCQCENEAFVDGGDDYLRYGAVDMDAVEILDVPKRLDLADVVGENRAAELLPERDTETHPQTFPYDKNTLYDKSANIAQFDPDFPVTGGKKVRATLKFKLPKEQDEYTLATHGADFWCVLWDVSQKLRDWLHHGHEFESADAALEAVQEELQRSMEDHNVSLEMVS